MSHRFLLITAFLLAGIPSVGPVRAQAGGRDWAKYFPLTEKSKWVYEITNHRAGEKRRFTAEVRESIYIPQLRRTLVIIDEDQLGEHHPVGYYQDEDGFLNRFVYLEYEKGKVIFPGTNSTPQRFLSANPSATHWKDKNTTIGSVQTWQYRVTNGLKIKVSAGDFQDCILVEASAPGFRGDPEVAIPGVADYSFRDWYAPNVGLIRSESVSSQFGEKPEVSYELLEYQIQPGANTAQAGG